MNSFTAGIDLFASTCTTIQSIVLHLVTFSPAAYLSNSSAKTAPSSVRPCGKTIAALVRQI